MGRRFCAAAARTRLDRGSHRRDRVSLGGGTQRALRRDRGRVRPAQGRCHCHGGNCAVARGKAGDIGHPDRLRGGGRPGRQRPGRESGATGRQRHRPVDPADRSCRQATRTLARGCPRSPPVGDHGQCRQSRTPCWRWARFRQRPARSASRSSTSEIRRAEDIAPAFEALKGRADALYVVCRPARESPTGFASTPWRWARDCRRCTVSGSTSKREV